MARLSKMEKHERLTLAVLCGVAAGLVLILAIRAILYYSSDAAEGGLAWLMGLAAPSAPLSSPSSTPAPVSAAAPASVSAPSPASSSVPAVQLSTPQTTGNLPIAPTSTLSSATYTESFSGTGFDDATDTTAYEDYVATSISLAPSFTVIPTTISFTPAPVTPAGAPADLTATVTAGTDQNANPLYTASIAAFPDLVVTSTYPGIVRFGYDPATGRTLVVYAAFESRVLEVGPSGQLIADYSPRFRTRAFAGDTYGSQGVNPVIFAQDGAWWIFSGDGSTMPRLIKIQDGAVIDYARTAFPNETTLVAAPGPSPHEIYVKGNLGSYLLTDNGFQQGPAQWVSSKLNEWDGNVTTGEITSVDASGTVEWFLSNDGGVTWFAVTPGTPFTFPTSGGDFRFKAVFNSGSGDPYATPWVHTVILSYSVQRSKL